MDDEILKKMDNPNEEDFGQFLHQLEIIEQVYPYFTNMIQNHMDTTSDKNDELESIMKKEKVD